MKTTHYLIGMLALVGVAFAANNYCIVLGSGTVCLNGGYINSSLGTYYFANNNTSGGGSDGNNYTSATSFSGNVLTTARIGMSSLTATIPNDAITLACQNITGAASNLCTITPGSGSGVTFTNGTGINITGNSTDATIGIINLEACNPVTEYSVWNGSHWSCDNDGGGGGGTVTSVTAGDGLTASPNPIVGAGTISTNALTSGTGNYSYWNGTAWLTAQDQNSGGTVTSVGINVNSSAVINVTAAITTSGNITISIPDASAIQSGLATATQITSLNNKALAGNCVGDNGTHVNVTMNATTAGVQCIEVLKSSSGGTSDGNNYTTTLTFTGNLLTLGRNGMTDLTALLLNNTILLDFANITNVPGFGYSNLTTVLTVNVTDFGIKQSYPATFQLNTTSTTYTGTVGNSSITLDTANITSGQLVDARISSADKWNHAGSSNITTVVVENITGVNVTNGTTHTLSIRVTDGNTFNVTFDDTTGSGSTQNITFNTTFTQYGFTYMENATQIGTNSLLQKQNATTVFVNNTLNTTYLVQNNFSNPYAFQTQFTKCWESEAGGTSTAGVSSVNAGWGFQTVSAGAIVSTASGGDNHPLITSLQDSTTANGGVMAILSSVTAGAFTPRAGDEMRAIFRLSSGKAGSVTARIGFMDTQSVAEPTDGCHVAIYSANMTMEARCRAASVTTANATTYTYSNATWYGASVKHINTTTANFTIWSDTGAVLLSVGLTSGVNTAASNPQLIATQSTADAAATIMDVDYIGFCRQYKPQRAWSYGQ